MTDAPDSHGYSRGGVCASVSGPILGQTHPSPVAALTQDEHSGFDQGGRAFAAKRYGEAYIAFRELLPRLPGGSPASLLVTKFAAESALDTRDRAFALPALQGIEASHPEDWHAACLLARAYAESGAGKQRDAEIARALNAHKRAGTPGNAARDFLLERIPLPNGSVDVLQAFEP